jgi:hypothetical protein
MTEVVVQRIIKGGSVDSIQVGTKANAINSTMDWAHRVSFTKDTLGETRYSFDEFYTCISLTLMSTENFRK